MLVARSKGTSVLLVNMPWMTGSPHDVRGALYLSAAPAEVATIADTINTEKPIRALVVLMIAPLLGAARAGFAQVAVHHFLCKLHAAEIHQARVGLDPPVQRHPDGPRRGEHARIFDGRFIADMVRVRQCESFGDLAVLG